MKHIFFIFLASTSLLYSQVGVNVENTATGFSNFALEIEGDLGISQPGEAGDEVNTVSDEFSTPLFWDVNTKRILTKDNLNKIEQRRYEIHVDTNAGNDFINNVDMGINHSEYTAFILNSELIRHTNGNETSIYIPVDGYSANRGTVGVRLVRFNNHNGELDFGQNGYFAQPIKKVFLKKGNKNWHLTADYAGSPFSFNFSSYTSNPKNINGYAWNIAYKWVIDILLIPTHLVDEIEKITAPVTTTNGSSTFNDRATVIQKLGALAKQP